MKTYGNFVANEWLDAVGGGHIGVRDPSTGAELARLARGTREDVDLAVSAAQAALTGEWGLLTATERGRILSRISAGVLRNVELLTLLEAKDVGKPLTQARADVIALARYFEFYGSAADKLHGDVIPYLNTHFIGVERVPHGVTGHIVPWNYPMQILGRSVGAALAAGNATVVKPAEDASLTILRVSALAREVGDAALEAAVRANRDEEIATDRALKARLTALTG